MKSTLWSMVLCASIATAQTENGTPAAAYRKNFWQQETPLQMTAQVGGGLALALTGGIVLGNIMASRESHRCRETIHADFSDGCGWSKLDGFAKGFMIGAPLGHALGSSLVGAIQAKHGYAWAALSAFTGDLLIMFTAAGLHNALDGKVFSNGKVDPWLIGIGATTMLAIPVTTQSIYDYKVEMAINPQVSIGATAADTRVALNLLQVRF